MVNTLENWRSLIDDPEEMPEHLIVALDSLLERRPIDGRLIQLYNEERIMLWLILAHKAQQVKKDVVKQVSKFLQRYVHKRQHWIL